MAGEPNQGSPRTAEELWKEIHDSYVIPPAVSPRSRRIAANQPTNADTLPADSRPNSNRQRSQLESANVSQQERSQRSASSVWRDIYEGYGANYRSASMENISPCDQPSHTGYTHKSEATNGESSSQETPQNREISNTSTDLPEIMRDQKVKLTVRTSFPVPGAGAELYYPEGPEFTHPQASRPSASFLRVIVPETTDFPIPTVESRTPSPEEPSPITPLFHGKNRPLSHSIIPFPRSTSQAPRRQSYPRGLVRYSKYESMGSIKDMYFDIELQQWRSIPDIFHDDDSEDSEEDDPSGRKKRKRLKDLAKSIIRKLKDMGGRDGDKDHKGKNKLSVKSISSPLGTSRFR